MVIVSSNYTAEYPSILHGIASIVECFVVTRQARLRIPCDTPRFPPFTLPLQNRQGYVSRLPYVKYTGGCLLPLMLRVASAYVGAGPFTRVELHYNLGLAV